MSSHLVISITIHNRMPPPSEAEKGLAILEKYRELGLVPDMNVFQMSVPSLIVHCDEEAAKVHLQIFSPGKPPVTISGLGHKETEKIFWLNVDEGWSYKLHV